VPIEPIAVNAGCTPFLDGLSISMLLTSMIPKGSSSRWRAAIFSRSPVT
jgi:hypothetical protein